MRVASEHLKEATEVEKLLYKFNPSDQKCFLDLVKDLPSKWYDDLIGQRSPPEDLFDTPVSEKTLRPEAQEAGTTRGSPQSEAEANGLCIHHQQEVHGGDF